jgi:predicted metal-dependent phosphoesterase TrpH
LADLHVHSALSPCGGDEMTPPAIVAAGRACGLGLLALCDHNAAGNVAATIAAARVREAGDAAALTVIAGMEITTAEEVHVVGLFPGAAQAEAAAGEVQATLPAADEAYYVRFGDQALLDADGRRVGREPRMLAAASALELGSVVRLIHRHGGLAVAAHLNRPSFSVLSQLGLFPEDAGFDAIEVFTPCAADGTGGAAARATAAEHGGHGLAVLAGSDAHYLADIGRARAALVLEAATFEELARALRGTGGRRVAVDA